MTKNKAANLKSNFDVDPAVPETSISSIDLFHSCTLTFVLTSLWKPKVTRTVCAGEGSNRNSKYD